MDLELKAYYCDDADARAAYKKFILHIHNLDFTEWEARGFWDPAHTPFSYFEGDRVVANVSIYLLDMVVNGEETRVAQISGVGTLEDRRRRGINRKLTEVALERVRGKHQGVFLFSDTDAIPFYKRCGFTPIEEFVETLDASPAPSREGAVRLDPAREEDLNRIHAYAKERTSVSDRFGVLNHRLLMFHVLYILRDCVYEIPDLDCLVFFRRKGEVLSVYDIVGRRVPSWEELYPYLAAADDRIIEFHFHTDKLGIDRVGTRPLVGNHPFVLGAFPFEKPVFPYTSMA